LLRPPIFWSDYKYMLKISAILLLIILLAGCGARGLDYSGYPTGSGEGNGDFASGSVENGDDDELEPETPPPDIPPYNEYRISLEVDPYERTVQGISRVTFTNRSDIPLETVVFRVFLNAFQEGYYPPPFFPEHKRRIFRGNEAFGSMEILYAFSDNEALEYELDGTVLTLFLVDAIKPEETVELLLQFSANVPLIAHRTGGNDRALWFGMFLPILAVHDENGWHTGAYYAAGHPFVLETANYRVDITTPSRYIVVGTGLRTDEVIVEDTDTKITHFSAQQARDFSFAISPYFQHAHVATESGVDIHFYFYSEMTRLEEIMHLASHSVEYFEYRVGRYPLGNITIVETDMMVDSVAFSQMVFVDTRVLNHSSLWALGHGIGRQWFSNVVGTNRITEPWLDEGLTRFVQAGIFYPTPEDFRNRMTRDYYSISDLTNLYISDGLWAYDNWGDFARAQGRKAMLMIYALNERMGDEVFWNFLNRYYQQFSFRMATGYDFMRLAEEAHGNSLEDFFDKWINGGTVPPLP